MVSARVERDAWNVPVMLLILVWTMSAMTIRAGVVMNVRDYTAVGDGKTDDTSALNAAMQACAAAGGGQVVIGPGKYLTGTVRLKSNCHLVLQPGAQILGTSDLDQYQPFHPPGHTPLASRDRWHRALLLGDNVENVSITGGGTINGNKVFDALGEEKMRGPHAVLFGNSRGITLDGIQIQDAANYAVFLEFTSDVDVRRLKITGGWDGVHFRGWKGNPCRNISITDCQLFTGDDCIAGWYWEHVLIDGCTINSSCNGIRLIGPASDLIIHDCLFFGPGRNEHRTSGKAHRKNMLAGLCLQPGSWGRTEGVLDDVKISNVMMYDVATPLHLAIHPGSSAGKISIDRLSASGAYQAAASIESWSAQPIEMVSLRDVSMQFVGGGEAELLKLPIQPPHAESRQLPAWGLFAHNVKALQLENVRLGTDKDDARPALIAHDVDSLDVNGLRLPRGASAWLSQVPNVALHPADGGTIAWRRVDLLSPDTRPSRHPTTAPSRQ